MLQMEHLNQGAIDYLLKTTSATSYELVDLPQHVFKLRWIWMCTCFRKPEFYRYDRPLTHRALVEDARYCDKAQVEMSANLIHWERAISANGEIIPFHLMARVWAGKCSICGKLYVCIGQWQWV